MGRSIHARGRTAAAFALLASAIALSDGGASAKDDRTPEVRDFLRSGPSESCVDVVFVGDGYQRKHLAPQGKYWADVKRYATRLLDEPPFAWYRGKFNVRAVLLESEDEGCDASEGSRSVRTPLDCCFDARDGRLAYFRDPKALAAALAGAGDVDIALVMVNAERYGGAGTVLHLRTVRGRPLPAPTFSAQDTASFLIALHELGHSFATLGDEYEEPAEADRFPLPADGSDLPHPNLTLPPHVVPTDRASIARSVKWRDFLALPGAKAHRWAHEGGYFRRAGVYRPWPRCRMRESADPYCPVCCKEMAREIVRACGDPWDDAGYHKQRPLSLWK